jgi:hypothetical protein
VPCPIRSGDIQNKKQKSRTKARMDARTRERLPVMPALTATDRERKDAAVRLHATRTAPPGALDHPGVSGGPQTWKDEGPWRHSGNTRRSCVIVILSFRVSQVCDLWCPVVDSVADGTLAA